MNALRRGVMVALMGLFLAVPAMARPGADGPGRLPSAQQLDKLADEIGIDAATKEKLKAQITAAREAGKAKREALKAARGKLHELLKADNPDRGMVMKQIEVVGNLEIEAQQHRIGAMLDVFGALTPEQRTQLRAKMAEWREHKGRRHGKGEGRGRGKGRGWDDGGDGDHRSDEGDDR